MTPDCAQDAASSTQADLFPNGPEALRAAVGRYLNYAWRVTDADDLATTQRTLVDMPDFYVYRFNWGSTVENGNSRKRNAV